MSFMLGILLISTCPINANASGGTENEVYVGKDAISETIQDAVKLPDAFTEFIHEAQKGIPAFNTYEKLQKTAEKYNKGELGGLKEFIINSYCNGGINVNKVQTLLRVGNSEYHLAYSIYDYFLPLGLIMLVLYFLMDIMTQTTSRVRDFDAKSFFMSFLKAVMGLAMLKYGYWIMGSLVEVSNTITNMVMNGKVVTGEDNQAFDRLYAIVVNAVGGNGVLDNLGLAMSAVVLQITQIIPEIIILFQAISRRIEIIFRVGIAPISMPDVYNGFSGSKAVTYLKRFAVVLLQGPMMIVIIKVAFQLQANHVAAVLDTLDGKHVPALSLIIEMALYGFAAAGLISSSKTALNDALGC